MLIIFTPFGFQGSYRCLKLPPFQLNVKQGGKKKKRQKKKIHRTERWNKMKWHRYLLAKEYYLSYWRLSLDGYKQLSSRFLQGRGQQISHIMHGVLLRHRLSSTGDPADTTKQTSPKATGKQQAQRRFLSHPKHSLFQPVTYIFPVTQSLSVPKPRDSLA